MRKLFMLIAAVALAACSEDATAPTNADFTIEEAADLAYGAIDMADPGRRFLPHLKLLPDSLKLTAEQEQQIRALIAAFVEETKTDLEALAAIHQEAREAKAAGQSIEEIRAILARGHAIREELHAAEQQLHEDILALLTPAQQAWLAAHRPHPCRLLQLTEEQKTEITALIAEFQRENQEDLELIKLVFEEARAAYQAGASRQEIAEILKRAQPAMRRVSAARVELWAAIRAVLTPAQLASGCFGPRAVRPGR